MCLNTPIRAENPFKSALLMNLQPIGNISVYKFYLIIIIFSMNKTKSALIIIISCLFLLACQSVSKKVDEKTSQEEKELSKWLNKNEKELKIFFGQPDKIEFLETRNRNYIYIKKKFKIKCERKFEINPNNVVIGFTSKNCF